MVVKAIFGTAMSVVPYRKDFYAKLAGPDDQALAVERLSEWSKAMNEIVVSLKAFLDRKEAKW